MFPKRNHNSILSLIIGVLSLEMYLESQFIQVNLLKSIYSSQFIQVN